MPVRHAPVHELRKADDVGANTQTALEKIAEINRTDRRQAPLFDERQEQLPEQEQAVEQSRKRLTFIGQFTNRCALALEIRILVDRKVPIEESLGIVQSFEQLP